MGIVLKLESAIQRSLLIFIENFTTYSFLVDYLENLLPFYFFIYKIKKL